MDSDDEATEEASVPTETYKVGKGKPPEHGKFQKGDGRKRGRRAKGTPNFATEFNEEMDASVSMTVNGKAKKVTRQRSIIMRVADSASRGVPSAVKLVFEMRQKIGDANPKKAQQANSGITNLENLTDEELMLYGKLAAKIEGVTLEAIELPVRNDPLYAYSQPPSLDHCHYESTVEGLYYRRYNCIGKPFDLLSVANKAYHSAALPRRIGCDYSWPTPIIEGSDDADIG